MLLTRLSSMLISKNTTLFLFITIILHLLAAKTWQSNMDFAHLSWFRWLNTGKGPSTDGLQIALKILFWSYIKVLKLEPQVQVYISCHYRLETYITSSSGKKSVTYFCSIFRFHFYYLWCCFIDKGNNV